MNVEKKILVTKASLPPLEEYTEEIRAIWDNHWLTNMGEKHNELQRRLESFMQVSHVELMVNGHMALEMALQAFKMKGEVITTPFTFASTTHAIVRNGLKPVFCDINDVDYTIDADNIESLITDQTCAIVPVHVYGNICDVKKIEEIARQHNLRVIYDAAHAFGESYNGVGVGNYGDASIFSFHATKVFNTIEGGCVTYSDESIGKNLYNLKNFGIKDAEHVIAVGANAKMNEFQAAMGLCNLRYIDENIDKRKKVVQLYQELLGSVKGIRIWQEQKDVIHNYAYFPIVVDRESYGMSRDALHDKLNSLGIGTRKYFYPLTCDFEVYRDIYNAKDCVVARKVSESVLTLPLYPDLDLGIVEYICNIISGKS